MHSYTTLWNIKVGNWDNQKHDCIVISDNSQGNVAAHLRYGGLFSYHFAMNLSLNMIVKKNFKIGEHLMKLQTNGLIVNVNHALFALQCPA